MSYKEKRKEVEGLKYILEEGGIPGRSDDKLLCISTVTVLTREGYKEGFGFQKDKSLDGNKSFQPFIK